MALSEEAIERAAAALHAAEPGGQPLIALPPGCVPGSVREAYTVQDRLVARLGATAGYKIAYINPAVQQRLGIDSPLFGRMIRSRVFQSPARLTARRFHNLIVETEFALRMARDLPSVQAPFSLETVTAAVGAAIPSFELADTRFADWRKVPAIEAACDNALGSHWVGGAELTDFRGIDLAALEVVSTINGREVARGRGAAVLGGPLQALQWLANELAQHGRGLLAGELITTGCCMDILEPSPGDTCEADFGPLGRVRVEFTA